MLHLHSQTGKISNLYKGIDLGGGRLGSVFTLVGAHGEPTNLVAKVIDTNLVDSELSQQTKIRLVVNEIKILNQLELLEGYVREDAIYTIVMKEVEGLQTHLFNGNSIKWEMYRAVGSLHRKNLLHFRKNPNHFSICPQYNHLKVSLIDFGLAEEATFCNRRINHLSILGRNFYSSPKLTTVLNFYVTEIVEYALKSKHETCMQLLLVAAITLSGLYGMPALAITHLIVKEFVMRLLWSQLEKIIEVESIEELIDIIQAKKIKNIEVLSILKNIVALLDASLSPYLIGAFLSYQWLKEDMPFVQHSFEFIADKSWQQLFANTTPALLSATATMYFPIAQLIEALQQCVGNAFSSRTPSALHLLFHYANL